MLHFISCFLMLFSLIFAEFSLAQSKPAYPVPDRPPATPVLDSISYLLHAELEFPFPSFEQLWPGIKTQAAKGLLEGDTSARLIALIALAFEEQRKILHHQNAEIRLVYQRLKEMEKMNRYLRESIDLLSSGLQNKSESGDK